MGKATFTPTPVRIKAVGVGGGGSNAISRMVRAEIRGVEFISVNTDAQALMVSEAPIRLQIGERITGGLGVGGDHIFGMKAAEESRDELRELVGDADMVFVTVGMGGGTGTGASPLIAELARESGALTIGIATKPFLFEGVRRAQVAEEGIEMLVDRVDTLIVIPNEKLLALADRKMPVDNAFKMVDDVLLRAVQAITEVVTLPGVINLDFADIKSIMKDAGAAWLSIGEASGQNRTIDAAKNALASPLLEVTVEGARGVLFTVTGESNLTLHEVQDAAEVIRRAVAKDANVIFGVNVVRKMEGMVKITLIATGFTSERAVAQKRKDDEFRRVIKDLEMDEIKLDTPALYRRPFPLRHAAGALRPKPVAPPPAAAPSRWIEELPESESELE